MAANTSSEKRIPVHITAIILVAIALLGGVGMWSLTKHGIGMGNDAVVYLAGARNIYSGEGFTWFSGDGSPRPINHYPPLFSTILGLSLVLKVPILTWARLLQVALFTLNILLLAALLWKLTASSFITISGGLIYAVSEELIGLHAWSMSDSLFTSLVLLFLFILLEAQKWRLNLVRVAGLAIVAALATLTRYVGVSLVVLLYILTMLDSDSDWAEKGQSLFVVTVLCMLPIGAWLWRNWVLTGSLTNRRAGWYLHPAEWWRSAAETVGDWFLPGRAVSWLLGRPSILAALGMVVAVLLITAVWRNYTHKTERKTQLRELIKRPEGALLLFLVIYTGSMLASAHLSYPDPDFSDRTLAPDYLILLILGLLVLGRIILSQRGFIRAMLFLIPLAFLLFKAGSARFLIERMLQDGLGYMSSEWQASDTIAALREMDPELIYTDNVGAVYFFTGQYAYSVPLKYDPAAGRVRSEFEQSYADMLNRLDQEGAVLVLFNEDPRLPEYAEMDEITNDVELIRSFDDGKIFVGQKSSKE